VVVTGASSGFGELAALRFARAGARVVLAARRLERAAVGREQNEMARDSYSYLHFLMVAGIVLLALGLKKTLGHEGDPLHAVPAFALLGGVALYLLGHVAFRYRHIHTINRQRLLLAAVLFALIPAALELPALAILALVNALIWAMIVYETISYGERRAQARREHFAEQPST